jgi:hypothetical protein
VREAEAVIAATAALAEGASASTGSARL